MKYSIMKDDAVLCLTNDPEEAEALVACLKKSQLRRQAKTNKKETTIYLFKENTDGESGT